MATTADGTVKLGFGIELELLLQLKQRRLGGLEKLGYKDAHKSKIDILRNRQAISKYLESRLVAVELPCQIRARNSQKDYSI
jgi:hypothetical protein